MWFVLKEFINVLVWVGLTIASNDVNIGLES